MSLRILITGATGQVGWQLQRTLAPLGEVIACTRSELDLSQPEAAVKVVRDLAPDIVANAGAYTAVDKAESDSELANTVNAVSPARIAAEVARIGGLLLHFSTDYVFDGEKPGPYVESDVTGPLSVYGRTKLAGEQGIAASECAHVILRTSWVYDVRGKNFLRTVLRLARERQELTMVADQRGAPTWARAIAEATAQITARCIQIGSAKNWGESGVFHLTAAGETTWAGFAEQILEEYTALAEWPADTGEWGSPLIATRVVPITTAQFPTPARRPRNSVLSNAKLQERFGLRLPDWRLQLRLALQDAVR
ncbi:MAG TPA: dTDP-4-dehydrorhamnose reductase [Candidatus Angelobacter sp.]|nr:dTDP-4-dehydrorhamnose reductase [Candidatus Angelobacter sp.]